MAPMWKRKVFAKGNSLGTTIPTDIVKDLKIKDGEQLEFVYIGNNRYEIRSEAQGRMADR